MRILTGTDIIEIKRIQDGIEKHGQAFLNKIFTAQEVAYCERRGIRKYESYAARFAAKEAVSKAFGTGISPNSAFHDIEVLNNERGKPCIILHGKALNYYEDILQGISADISLSHSDTQAVAFVSILTK